MNMTSKQRLLDQISPLTYDLLLKPDLKEFTFLGEETLTFKLLKQTKEITLHAHSLKIRKAVLLENEKEYVAQVTYNKKAKTVTFHFPHIILTGQKKLHMVFTGVIGEKLKGWYKSAYEVNDEKRYLATTQFEEIGAREVFPSIDDPSAKAIFTISFSIPSHLTAISNTIDTVTPEKGGYKTVSFSPTPKMSPYVLAFIVGEFEYIEKKTASDVTVRVFVTPGKKSQAEFVLDTAAKMLSFYETYFDIAYPLPVLDLIAIPDFDAGAMENWGAITAREAALLVDPMQTSAANKQYVAIVIAHELTHMWFGNLVTMKWWDDLWLNEGFASYMEYKGVDEFFPEWHMWEQFAVLDHNRALGLDSLENTHPIQSKITDVEKISEIFDEVSYSKGACIIQMIVEYIGEKDFRDGIRYYLKKHSYGNTTTSDLWEALEKVSGKNVSTITKTYTEKPGHPLIIVKKSQHILSLSQTRFFSSSISRKKSKDKTIWSIPLKILDGSKKSTEIVFHKKDDYLQAAPSWIKVNSGETSFARVIYTKDLYALLQKPIEEKILASVDRMGLIRDVFDCAESGYVSTDLALSLAKQYIKESSYIVWACLAGKLGNVENLLSEDETLLSLFRDFGRQIFTTIGRVIGWNKRENDMQSDILLRNVVLSSLGGYKDVDTIAKAKELFETIVVDGRNAVDTDIRGVVYALTAENSGEKEFELLKQMYIKEDLSAEKNRIGGAMCLFEDPDLIAKALEFSLSDHVRHQDIGRFLVTCFGNRKGREVTWNFIKKHWTMLLEKMEGLSMDWIIDGAASVTSPLLAKDINVFFDAHPHPSLEKAMKQVSEQMESNIAWLKRDREAIEKFLSKKV